MGARSRRRRARANGLDYGDRHPAYVAGWADALASILRTMEGIEEWPLPDRQRWQALKQTMRTAAGR